MRFSFLFLFLSFALIRTFAFSNLVPYFSYFSQKDYQAGKKNWGFTQDNHGFIFVANNNGVLRYDGTQWKKINIKAGNHTVRSVFADTTSNRIYVGMFEEFGYLTPRADGSYEYVSLSDSLEGFSMQNDEVWNIIRHEGKIYFQTFASFFVYDGQRCEGHAGKGCYLYFMQTAGQIYSYIIDNGVYQLDTKSNQLQPTSIPADLGRIIQIRQDGDLRYIVTEMKGIYLQTAADIRRIDSLGDNYPIANRALFSNDEQSIYIGSIDKGLFCFDRYGKLNWTLDTHTGLPDNTVLNLFQDRNDNVWIALTQGVALLHNNSSLRYYASPNKDIGILYGASLYQDRLYLSSNQGVFVSEKNEYEKLSRVESITSQTWLISQYDKQLFFGGNNNTFTLQHGNPCVLSQLGGGLCMTKATINEREVLLQGTYTKIGCYQRATDNLWSLHHPVEGFMQPIRFLEVDYQGNVWAAHHYKGLYRLRMDDSLKNVVQQEYFASLDSLNNAQIAICKIDKRVVFSDGIRLYVYNDIEQKIIPYERLNSQLDELRMARRIVAAGNDAYWFITDRSMALVRISQENVTILDIIDQTPFKHLMVEDAENIIPLGGGKHLICLEGGYLIYDEENRSKAITSAKLHITQVSVLSQGKTVLLPIENKIPLRSDQNQLFIHVAYPTVWENSNFRLAYRCDDSNDWIFQDKKFPVFLQSISPGKHLVSIRILDWNNKVIDQLNYRFEIETPFYQTGFARLLYLMAIILAFFVLKRFMHYRYEKRKNMAIDFLKQQQEQDKQQQQQEIFRLQNEKLEAELAYKSKELANYALQELNQKEMLRRIREEVLENSSKSASSKQSVAKLMKMLDGYIDDNKSWNVFEQNFDLIHQQFFRTLHRKYPVLTSNDLRLCAYLRLNLTTKEIADLLNITVKGVEVARYRLRKKLNISPDVELLKFFLEQIKE
ncbi:MAG: two-component regulator propeller domain-containing protein [Bacteroidales bacterium]